MTSTATSAPTTPTAPTAEHVTMLGLGPMGQAMATALLGAGHTVTVWNRTPSRADSLVAAGAILAGTPREAVGASGIALISLTDYQAMWDILDGATESLAGRTLVNLSSDTPDRTRRAATWAESHGATFLSGGIMVPAPMIGTEVAYAYYSGSTEAFAAHRETLTRIGEPKFLGEDPGHAQLMYQANLDLFLTTLAGFAHATALTGAAGIPAQTFLPEVMQLLSAIPAMIASDGAKALGARIDAGEHPGVGSNIVMMGATADHVVASSESLGIDTALPRAVQDLYLRAIADGHGSDGWTRTIDSIRTEATRAA